MSSVFPVPAPTGTLAGRPGISIPIALSERGYRADIEGLRGIAVLSVLAVHSFPDWLHGGFIGVDIFFVLSGYLISLILFQSLEAGRFSLIDFYARRIRRIYPALCLVLLACLVFSVAFTFPSESRQVGKHVAAGAIFLSNFALWTEAGYFDVASEAKPLLHLWSLGIEEQFYLLWPLATVLLLRHRRWAVWLIVLALLLSFTLNVAFVADKAKAVFFLPPTRFWELLVGAWLAWLTLQPHGGPVPWLRQRLAHGSRANRYAADAFAWAGLLMLACALWLIDKTDHFPGWWALLPTAGTFALLAAGPDAAVNRHLLSRPILRFYGTISYPLYLWHWPLLCFPTVLGLALTNELRVMILIASVVLAALTCEFVEKPVRFGARHPRLPLMLLAAMGAIGLFGWGLKQSDGLLAMYPPSIRGMAAAEFEQDFPSYRVDECFLRLEQGPESFSDGCVDRAHPENGLMFLWGDSHAASMYPGLAEMVGISETRHRLAQYTAAACPPLMDAPALSTRHCAAINRAVLEHIAAERPAVVVLAANWAKYGSDGAVLETNLASLQRTVRHLRSLGVERVVVFGQLPTWSIPQPRVVMKAWSRTHDVPERTLNHLKPESLTVDRAVASSLAGLPTVFISPINRLCDASGCLVSLRRGESFEPVTYDESHLSPAGSKLLIERSRSELAP